MSQTVIVSTQIANLCNKERLYAAGKRLGWRIKEDAHRLYVHVPDREDPIKVHINSKGTHADVTYDTDSIDQHDINRLIQAYQIEAVCAAAKASGFSFTERETDHGEKLLTLTTY
jgi:hypothetical protein